MLVNVILFARDVPRPKPESRIIKLIDSALFPVRLHRFSYPGNTLLMIRPGLFDHVKRLGKISRMPDFASA